MSHFGLTTLFPNLMSHLLSVRQSLLHLLKLLFLIIIIIFLICIQYRCNTSSSKYFRDNLSWNLVPFWALWPPGSGFYYLMLLPPTGAGAAQLAGAWTHQSLTESLVFFFLHVQGLKMGRIQPISARQTLFHLICAFTRVLFSFLTLSSRSIRCFSSDTRMLSLQDTSH